MEKEEDRRLLQVDTHQTELVKEMRYLLPCDNHVTYCHSDEIRKQYQDMERDAERRQARAEWRAKRFALARKRLEQLKHDYEVEERDMDTGSQTPTGMVSPSSMVSPSGTDINLDDIKFNDAKTMVPDLLSTGDESKAELKMAPSEQHLTLATPIMASTRGTAPQSTIQDIIYPRDRPATPTDEHQVVGVLLEPLVIGESVVSQPGHHIAIKDIIYPDVGPSLVDVSQQHSKAISSTKKVQRVEPINTRGCPPNTTIENVLYFGRKGIVVNVLLIVINVIDTTKGRGEDTNEDSYEVQYPPITAYSSYGDPLPEPG